MIIKLLLWLLLSDIKMIRVSILLFLSIDGHAIEGISLSFLEYFTCFENCCVCLLFWWYVA